MLLQSLLMQQKECIALNPSSILLDFEQGMINAIDDVFSQTLVKGCHFD